MNRKLVYLLFALLIGFASKAQNDDNFKITHGPYLQALSDSSATIVWTTNKTAIAWVEIAPVDSTHFYYKERPKFFASKDGFKTEEKVHRVRLTHLKPNTRYRYRIYSQEVLSHEWVKVRYGETVATNVFSQKPLEFKTFNPRQKTTSFAIVNDIHERGEVLQNLFQQLDIPSLDFMVFNGDMVTSFMSEDQIFKEYMDLSVEKFAKEKPFYYARGNHETRGPFAPQFSNYFPSPNGKLYYFVRHGETALIFLDTGEDKPDSDIEYSGITDMDAYRSEQAEWLKEVVKAPAYKNAKYKVVIGHMPPFGGWHGEQEVLQKFVPVLNGAGAQIMLAAHFHRHMIQDGDEKIHFPVIVNSNSNLIQADINSERALFKVIDQKGKIVDQLKIEAE